MLSSLLRWHPIDWCWWMTHYKLSIIDPMTWRHNIQHTDTRQNNTHRNVLNYDTLYNTFYCYGKPNFVSRVLLYLALLCWGWPCWKTYAGCCYSWCCITDVILNIVILIVFMLSIVMLNMLFIVMLNVVMLCASVLNLLKSLMFCAKWLKAMRYYIECRGTNYLGY